MAEQCQVEYCNNPAKFALYKTFPDGTKKWLHVCRLHESEIGRENLHRAGGRYERHIEWEEEPLKT